MSDKGLHKKSLKEILEFVQERAWKKPEVNIQLMNNTRLGITFLNKISARNNTGKSVFEVKNRHGTSMMLDKPTLLKMIEFIDRLN